MSTKELTPSSTDKNNNLETSSDGVVGRPIDFDLQAQIRGQESQILIVTLEPGQVLRAESGAMMYLSEGVEMNTTSGGGLSSGFARMLTGQNFFVSDYTYQGDDTGELALPGNRLSLQDYACQFGRIRW